MKKRSLIALVTGVLTAGSVASAQSQDALLNKLVQKGLLTQQEAEDLKKESDSGFDKAYRSRTGLPDWVTQLKLYGDLRGRYDNIQFESDEPGLPNTTRNQFRYRLRVGATATLKDNLELGFRFISGDYDSASAGTIAQGGSPLSGNSTLQNNGSKKPVFIDLAYGKWTPIKNKEWNLSLSIGKIENPFVLSDLVFDTDYTPEGAALAVSYNLNEMHSFRFAGGGFLIDEVNQGANAGHDPLFVGGQARWDAKWSKCLDSSLGIAAYNLSGNENLGNGAIPNINTGNTRLANGLPAYHYNPLIADAWVGYSLDRMPGYNGAFPIRVSATVMHNPAAPDRNDAFDAGITFGKSGKKGAWEVGYRYKYLEADANFEEFPDNDFGAFYGAAPGGGATVSGKSAGYNGGTGVRGHVIKISYSPYDALLLTATYALTDLIHDSHVAGNEIDSGTGRLFVDATWRF